MLLFLWSFKKLIQSWFTKPKFFFKLLKLMSTLTLINISPAIIRTLCGFLAFTSNRKHLLNALLRLEFIILRIFWILTICLRNFSPETFLTIFFLTLVACEGALGLSLLVSIVRTHGNDFFNSFNTLQC